MALDSNDRRGATGSAAQPDLPADLPSQLRTQVERFRELRERGEQVRAQLAAAQATARSTSGSVTITVGAGGVLQQVQLGEPARKLPLGKLSEDIMAAYRAAAREVADQGVEIMSTLVGADSPTLQLLRDAAPPDSTETQEGIRP